jgi:uncharacterized membrane protein
VANVLIRDVSPEDLDEIKEAAAERGVSLQAYLREALHGQAAYLRRRKTLDRLTARFAGRSGVADEEREAVLDAIDAANDERARWLADPTGR